MSGKMNRLTSKVIRVLMIARLLARLFPATAHLLAWLFGPPPPPRQAQVAVPRLRLREVPGELLERALCWIARRAVATARGCKSWRLAYRSELAGSDVRPTPREALSFRSIERERRTR